MPTINEEVPDDYIPRLARQRIWILQECRCEDNKRELENRMIADDRVLAERFRPKKIGFAKHSAKETPCKSEKDKDEVVDWIVIYTVICLEKHQFTSTIRIECLQDDRSKE